jgi:broad specificity phosphatase PhoE
MLSFTNPRQVTVDNLLREFDRGYHGQTHDDVMAWNLARREYGMCQYRFQNGESLEDVYARASTWVALFHSFLDLGWVGYDDTVVIVCHAVSSAVPPLLACTLTLYVLAHRVLLTHCVLPRECRD